MGSDSELLSARAKSHLNMLFVVTATLLIGNALHVSVVTGQQAVTAPTVAAQLVAGVIVGLLGVLLRDAPRERWGGADEGDEADADFDPEMSPLDDEALDRPDE